MSIKFTMLGRVQDVRQGTNSLRSSEFGDVFFWQEVSLLADKELKKAWKELQEPDEGKPVLDNDDMMRKLGGGEHVIEQSKLFTVMVKVTAARNSFDAELFAAKAAKAFKVPKARVEALLEKCRVDGKPQLTKRVLENER